MAMTIKRHEFTVQQFERDGEVKGGCANFPRDPEAQKALKAAFPRLFWSRAGGCWYLPGKLGAKRLEKWADEHLESGDQYLADQLHDEHMIEPVELPPGVTYNISHRYYAWQVPYDEELVDLLKAIPRAAWRPETKVWVVPITSRREMLEALPAIRERLAVLAKAARAEIEARDGARRKASAEREAKRSQPRTLRAQYQSPCTRCGKTIQVGERIIYQRGAGSWHAGCDQVEEGQIRLSGGSGYGYTGWERGQVIRNGDRRVAEGEPRYLMILTASETYYREDGMSFGAGEDRGYVYSATAREATEEESSELRERDALRDAQAEAIQAVEALRSRVQEEGEAPPRDPQDPDGRLMPEGERLLDTQDIYGGGDWWVVGPEWIWYIRNNGMDGDNWSYNNIRTGGAGAIGWRIPYEDEAEAVLRRAVEAVETAR